MTRLREAWTPRTRFDDEEKAQLFIGYLAAFPQSERAQTEHTAKEETEHG